MEYYPFPALLLANYNETHEYGQAIVGPHGCIDFISDFVPLLPLGAAATIEWVLGDKQLTSFSGNVYLSSPQLLRLVDVDEHLLVAARDVFAVNTRLPASISMRPQGRANPKLPQHPVEILYLTDTVIKLRTASSFETGSMLSLFANVEFLTLHNLPLRVIEHVTLRKNETILLCEIQKSNDENFIALSTYSARLAAAESAN